MKLFFKILCASLLLSSATAADLQPLGDELKSIIDDAAITGAAVGVVIGDELAFSKGYGVARLGGEGRVTPRHVFHWASVAKPLVGIAVMQLVEQGRVDLDAPATDYLPYFEMADPRYRAITIRHLLLHTSGMPDVEDYEWDAPQTDDGALKRWIRELASRNLLSAPGDERRYSNIGYEILGAVVAAASGQSFEDYMADHIFGPLGMSNSSFFYAQVDPALRVSGHMGDPRRIAPHYPYNRRHAPSSTLNTNVEDMSLLARALLNGGQLGNARVLGAEALSEMWEPTITITEDPYRGGALGWGVRDYHGRMMIGHSGGDDGFRSYLALIPDAKIAVLLEANDDIAIMSSSPDEPMLRMLSTALDAALEAAAATERPGRK